MERWFDGNIDRIADLLREGLSASQIAAHFRGVSKNAVIGIVGRNAELKAIGFKRRPGKQEPKSIAVSTARKKNVRGGKVSKTRLRIVPPTIDAIIDAAPARDVTSGAPHVAGIDLLMLNECRCKWPINDGGPFLFCGEAKEPGRAAYCDYHAALSVGQGTESERSAVRQAMKVAA